MPVYEEKEKIDGQKVYFIRCYIKGPNGKMIQIKRKNKKEWIGREGKILAQQEEIRLLNSQLINFENITIDEIASDYLENLKRNWKESTYLKNKDNYQIYIKPYFGYRKAKSLTTKDILDWKNCMMSKGFALNYLKGFYSTFSALMNFGVKYYDIKQNVVRIEGNFTAVKGKKKKEMKVITSEQFEEAIQFEEDIFYHTAFILLFWLGIRRGEMLSLNINDLDFESNTIRIDETTNPKISKTPHDPKTDKSNRILPVKKEIMFLLKELITKYKFEDGYIFLNNITLSTLKRKSDRMLKKIGLDDESLIRIHDYRHSFATMCIHSGVEIQVLSDYMGHENISITWDTYGHLYPDSKKTLLDKISLNFLKKDANKS